ncbi:glycoside hydrolase family 6 protein [Nocardioides dokdonensis]|uniref:glycoside hydrolase family 6 protein n=1 Tax=Nocardioides dokdonensis TaxID=450734 RepID=UPI00147250C5|nr:glycoside hydrolase family 6 protein [Nocardioides dokdonensis]
MPARRPAPALVAVAALVALALLAVTAVLVVRGLEVGPFAPGPQGRNHFADRATYVDPDSKARAAATRARADGDLELADRLDELASVPSGIWLTPEQHPIGAVGAYVTGLVSSADERDEVPLLVLYGVPERDCAGLLSAGGLPPEDYPVWVGEVAAALGTAVGPAVVVLEPDALATAEECGRRDERVDQLGAAVDLLADAGVTTYVDAGHSDWIPARAMARMLEEVGVARVRGFATNVANYQRDADEQAYARTLDELLPAAQHWVVDRGRNGNGATDEWCNPPESTLGQRPGFVDDGSGLDAYLWVKPPGESDGTCGGGPPAGEFWAEGALRLLR